MASVKSLEDKLQELELIANALDNISLPIDEAISKFQDGAKLIKECKEYIQHAEMKITDITNNSKFEINSEKGEENK